MGSRKTKTVQDGNSNDNGQLIEQELQRRWEGLQLHKNRKSKGQQRNIS